MLPKGFCKDFSAEISKKSNYEGCYVKFKQDLTPLPVVKLFKNEKINDNRFIYKFI